MIFPTKVWLPPKELLYSPSLKRKRKTRHLLPTIYCGVEQLVARRAHNPKVIGSSPVPATTTDALGFKPDASFFCPSRTPTTLDDIAKTGFIE